MPLFHCNRKDRNKLLAQNFVTPIINICEVKFKITLDKHKTYSKN